MAIISFFSVQFGFIFYALYWFAINERKKFIFNSLKDWDVIQGKIIKTSIYKDCSFYALFTYRCVECVSFPKITYQFNYQGEDITSTKISLFPEDFSSCKKDEVNVYLRKYIKSPIQNIYVNQKTRESVLDIKKNHSYYWYLITNYFIGGVILMFALLMS